MYLTHSDLLSRAENLRASPGEVFKVSVVSLRGPSQLSLSYHWKGSPGTISCSFSQEELLLHTFFFFSWSIMGERGPGGKTGTAEPYMVNLNQLGSLYEIMHSLLRSTLHTCFMQITSFILCLALSLWVLWGGILMLVK